MRRVWGTLMMVALVAALASGCGDSGPEGPNARFIEEMEELGVSREQAERDAREIDQQVARESRRSEARFQRDLERDEKRWARERSEGQLPAEDPADTAPPNGASGGFRGKYAERYKEDRIVCGLVPHSQIATEFGIRRSSHPVEVAEAYAEGFYGKFEQAAFEGCLDGIEDRLGE